MRRWPPIPIFSMALLAAGGLIAALPILADEYLSKTSEIQIGVLMVMSVAIFMVLLFVMTTSFSAMGIADRNEALGLPPGSIRAMIALLLILVFVVLSLYLFNVTSRGFGEEKFSGLTTEEIRELGLELTGELKDNKDGTFDGEFTQRGSDEGKQIGLQLVTTLGTLAVAVSAFYFGTSSVAAAKETLRTGGPPRLTAFYPPKGKGNGTIEFRLFGSDLSVPRTVRLLSGAQIMPVTEFFASHGEIRGSFEVSAESLGKWDVVVDFGEGTDSVLKEAFEVEGQAPDSVGAAATAPAAASDAVGLAPETPPAASTQDSDESADEAQGM